MSPSTIVILGGEEDEHAQHVLTYLRRKGHDAELLDSRWFPQAATITLDPQTRRGEIGLPNGNRLDLASIRSVYWRSYDGVGAPQLPDTEQAWIAENDARGLFETLLIATPARWVNGWDAFRLHQTKPLQLALVAELGARIPATRLTNDPQALREFAARHAQSILKPVQGGDYALRLREEHLAEQRLNNLELAPITVQEEIVGTNIRVFIFGDRVLACEVRTDQIDYRLDQGASLHVHGLPQEMVDLVRRIARKLKLVWSGIDFRLAPDGSYVFLEANPSPMFLGFERQTGLPLTASLAELLTGG